MISRESFSKAIIAHGIWKQRLAQAITKGKSRFTASEAADDHLCEVGQWLYALPSEEQKKPIWHEVRKTHARFHAEAAMILELALNGSKGSALELISGDSLYARLSNTLRYLLNSWVTAPNDVQDSLFYRKAPAAAKGADRPFPAEGSRPEQNGSVEGARDADRVC